MEKKINGLVKPGKAYIMRFRPKGTPTWSENYEFSAPRPTKEMLSGAGVSESDRIVCSVKLTSNKTYSSLTAVSWDDEITDVHGMWHNTLRSRIYTRIQGWYMVNLQTSYTVSPGSPAGIIVSAIRKNGAEVIASQVTESTGNGYYHCHSVTTRPVYCDDNDYFQALAQTVSSGVPLVPEIAGTSPITQMTVTYMGT